MRKITLFCMLALSVGLFISCEEKEEKRQTLQDLNFDGENQGGFLFEYFADYYTDTYQVADGKLEIRVDYEFFSTWGCISYYIRVEHALRKTIETRTISEIITNADQFAAQTANYFAERHSFFGFKLRNFRITNITLVE